MAPQSSTPPHPSPMMPQYWSAQVVQVMGTQGADTLTHRPLSQVSPALQGIPQSSTPPQPSPIKPQ